MTLDAADGAAAVDELKRQVLGHLDVVVQQLDYALESIICQDAQLGRQVVAGDEQIVQHCEPVHRRILSSLAEHTPGTAEFQTLAALLHLVRGAVRIEAECVKIAQLAAISVYEEPRDAILLEMIERVGRLSLIEVSLAKQAFALRNVEVAHDAVRADSELRALNRQVLARAVDFRDGQEVRDWAMSLFLVACRLERIGDNAVDIAEQTLIVDRGLDGEVAAVQPEPQATAAM